MARRDTVSHQVKVVQGKKTTTFELANRGLVIEHFDDPGYIRFVLKEPAIQALRELIFPHPSMGAGAAKPPASVMTREELEERFGVDAVGRPAGSAAPPSGHPEGEPDAEGLHKQADGVVEGMDE